MSIRRLLLLFLALGVSGATVLVARAVMAPRVVAEAVAPTAAPATRVLVAQGDLSAGQFVRPENLRWEPWPAGDVPKAYVVDGKGQIDDYVGSVVRSSMTDGEPVTDGRIVRPGDRGFLAAVLTPGDRAVSVPVTVSSGIAGFVFPGDRVDILLTMSFHTKDANEEHRHAAETLLTNIRVLAMDQRSDDQNKEVAVAKTATLEVTPQQAETVAVAIDMGNLSLSLRSLGHGNDDRPAQSLTWDIQATHITPPPDAAIAKPAPQAIKVILVRGTDAKEFDFPRSGP
jgi:pilus assembly protein CpaB